MPRPILKVQQAKKNESQNELQLTQQSVQQNTQMDKMRLYRLLRKTRSKEYMNAIHRLDVGGHVHNQGKVDEIIAVIKREFPEVELAGSLLGFVSKCYLGAPYEVHTLDLVGRIIEHYPSEFIEVYSDCCRAVSSDGSVAVIS